MTLLLETDSRTASPEPTPPWRGSTNSSRLGDSLATRVTQIQTRRADSGDVVQFTNLTAYATTTAHFSATALALAKYFQLVQNGHVKSTPEMTARLVEFLDLADLSVRAVAQMGRGAVDDLVLNWLASGRHAEATFDRDGSLILYAEDPDLGEILDVELDADEPIPHASMRIFNAFLQSVSAVAIRPI